MSDVSARDIRRKLAEGACRLSDHALRRVVERNISSQMIREAGEQAEVIEDYPDDKYGPSCLLLVVSSADIPWHVHVSRRAEETVKIITLYVPDPERWIDNRIRKDQS